MPEDTPEYFERPECNGCVIHTLKQLGSEAALTSILVTKEQRIRELVAAYERLRQRHQELLVKIAERATAGGRNQDD